MYYLLDPLLKSGFFFLLQNGKKSDQTQKGLEAAVSVFLNLTGL